MLDIIARSLNSTLKNTNKFLIKKIVQKSTQKNWSIVKEKNHSAVVVSEMKTWDSKDNTYYFLNPEKLTNDGKTGRPSST